MGPYSGLSLRGSERLCPSEEHGIIVLVLNCNVLIADSCSLQEFEGSSHIPSTKLTVGQARDHGDCCVQKMECKTVVVSSSIGSVVTVVNSKQRTPSSSRAIVRTSCWWHCLYPAEVAAVLHNILT